MKIKTVRYYLYYTLRVFSPFIACLPVRLASYLGGQIGKAVFIFLKKEKVRTLEHLRAAFPEKSDSEIRRLARKVFSNLGRNAAEFFHIYKINRKNIGEWVSITGREKVDKALERGKGILMLAAHFGNWELISIYFALLGYKGNVIARRLYFDKYDRLLNRMRALKFVRAIYRDESPKKILRALKNNGIIGILADQDMPSVDGVFVDFFGRPAYTPVAPAAIALASKAALMPCFIIRRKNRHEIIVEDPIELEIRETKEETLRVNTERWSDVVESYIRRYPDHWVWMHERWKTEPRITQISR